MENLDDARCVSEEELMLWMLLSYENCPIDIIRRYAFKRCGNYEFFFTIVKNPNTPTDVLEHFRTFNTFMNDSQYRILYDRIKKHPNCPEDIKFQMRLEA